MNTRNRIARWTWKATRVLAVMTVAFGFCWAGATLDSGGHELAGGVLHLAAVVTWVAALGA